MNLQSRVLILYLCIAVLVLVLIGGVLPASLHEQNLNTISEDNINQLRHVDFALSNFIGEVRYDVLELSLDEDVRTPDDPGFTNFLNASEDTFRYSYSEKEQAIIDTFRDYQTTHPYVSSVYMGRENGAFVRSFPRARPTQYDPRDRPWYILAKEHPGQVMVTEPYQAVTTPDINIGIVNALRDKNGTVYGVVGADITLVNLTSYISRFDVGRDWEMVLVDENGMILAARNSSRLFGNISDVLQEQPPAFLTTKEGVLVLNGTYLMYYTSPELGWKIGVFVPFSSIEQKINESIARILLFVILALVLLSVITIIMLNQTIIRPLSSLTEVSRRIAETGDLDQKIETGGTGEIGILSRSFKTMVERIHTDITERERAEEALRESETRYREFFTTSRDCVFITSPAGRWIDFNDAALELFGYGNRDELMARPIGDLYENKEERKKFTALIVREGYVREYPVRLRRKDGTIIETLITAVPLREADGALKAFIGSIRDITERKRAQQALADEATRRKILIDQSRDGIVTLDQDGGVYEANQRFADMLGYSAEEVRQLHVWDWDTQIERERLLEMIRTVDETGDHFETRHQRRDGTVYDVEISTNAAEFAGKKLIFCVCRDITDRKLAEERLRRFNEELEKQVAERTGALTKMIGEREILLREVHHRVKNNMQIITSLLNLQSRSLDNPEVVRMFRESQNRIKAMALVHERLYRSGDLASIDLGDYIGYIAKELFSFYGVKPHLVRFNVNAPAINVGINTAIPVGLMVNELISNAIKYAFPAGRKGEIVIDITKEDKDISLVVRDNGVGIPADFDWRNARSLGLRLVISLVEQLFGTIELDRTEGTTFKIVIKEKE